MRNLHYTEDAVWCLVKLESKRENEWKCEIKIFLLISLHDHQKNHLLKPKIEYHTSTGLLT